MKSSILFLFLSLLCICSSFGQTNRGRLQAQGSNLELSKSWAQNSTFTKSEALAKLVELYDSLSSREQADRKVAYDKARAYILKAPGGGVCGKVSKTFQDPQRKDKKARIDIEVITGCAFTDY